MVTEELPETFFFHIHPHIFLLYVISSPSNLDGQHVESGCLIALNLFYKRGEG